MNPEKPGQELLDADILQCRADILQAMRQTAQTEKVRDDSSPEILKQKEDAKQVPPAVSLESKKVAAGSQNDQEKQIASLQQQLTAKDPDIQTISVKNRQAQETISSLREQIEDLRDNLQNAQRQLQEKQVLIERLSEVSRQQQQALEQKEPAETKNLQLQSRLDSLEKQKQELERKLEQTNSSLGSLEVKTRALQGQIEQKQQQISAMEHSVENHQQEQIRLSLENEVLRQNISQTNIALGQKQSELEKVRTQLDSLRQENQQLLVEVENRKQQTEALHAERQQKEKQLAEQTEHLQSRIRELENQAQKLSEKTSGEKTGLQTLMQEYQTRLEKAERQKRETENRLAAVQAHNDRLLAGEAEMERLREQLRQAEQKNATMNRQLEQLKGDHQLVGEENNQLHHLLHLRDQELERMHQQIKELNEKLAEMKKPEVSVSPEELEMLRTPADISTGMETEPAETAESRTEIPSFNLAEQIMAEHRRTVASQRQAPGGQPQAGRKDSIQQVVSQFVSSPEPVQEAVPQVSYKEAVTAAPETSAMLGSADSNAAEAIENDVLIAEIVRRDILRFLEVKKQAFQRTDWMWKSN